MKRYLVFAWPLYAPEGGAADLRGNAATPEEVEQIIAALPNSTDEGGIPESLTHGNVLDTATGEICQEFTVPNPYR